ncbi:MAG: pirin family protein, partial [Pseudomonadota bacterium]
MLTIRRSAARGRAQFGWLDSRHTFSFGPYFDGDHMGFGPLRVINEDKVAPGRGFDAHAHADMEILSIVLSGALAHEDSTGRSTVIRPGDVQRMTAGTGVRHSEFNASQDEPVHFLQVWIIPEAQGLAPGYEQASIPRNARRGRLTLLGSRDGRDGAVVIQRDVDLHGAVLAGGQDVSHAISSGRGVWVQVLDGA